MKVESGQNGVDRHLTNIHPDQLTPAGRAVYDRAAQGLYGGSITTSQAVLMRNVIKDTLIAQGGYVAVDRFPFPFRVPTVSLNLVSVRSSFSLS